MSVYLEAYDPKWAAGFLDLKAVLETALKGLDIDIQHVGSTAVPGLWAKPTLDIDIVIQDKTSLHEITARLKALGYRDKGEQGIPGRFAFRQASDRTPQTGGDKSWPEHHLYVCFADSWALKNHLLFRDRLLADKALASQYTRLKKQLAAEPGMTRDIYTVRKTGFITEVLSSIGLDEEAVREIAHTNRCADGSSDPSAGA